MKYIDEYRNRKTVSELAKRIARITQKPWKIMEVCGGQTHAIMKFGLQDLLPQQITLVHGPGCPVCVTPLESIDKALWIASQPNTIFCSYGDMMRVPGSKKDLLAIKSEGGDVRMVQNPMYALKIARDNPNKKVVFFAVGFETTAPATAMALYQAKAQNLSNFSVLSAHVLVPSAIEAILSSEHCQIQGFLAAGHVCTVMGFEEYVPISKKYKIPIVVTGFEPVDILSGVYLCVKQLEEGRFEVENEYARIVRRAGNTPAQKLLSDVFEVCPRKWRGIGNIDKSGLNIKAEYADFDAENKFGNLNFEVEESKVCIAGLVLQGLKKPHECKAFGRECSPESPLGAPMVSSEGACAAYYKFRKR